MEGTEKDVRLYVILLNRSRVGETPRELIMRHVGHIRRLDQEHRLVLCGPFADYEGGMVIVRASSKEEAEGIAASDPFVVEGSRTFEVRTWIMGNAENEYLAPGPAET